MKRHVCVLLSMRRIVRILTHPHLRLPLRLPIPPTFRPPLYLPLLLSSSLQLYHSTAFPQYQTLHNSTHIRAFPRPGRVGNGRGIEGYYQFITASDKELGSAIDHAHRLGLKVMLKPQVDLSGDSSQYWRGSIGEQCSPMPDAAYVGHWDRIRCAGWWDRWFHSYGRMIRHYARLAARFDVEQLSVR